MGRRNFLIDGVSCSGKTSVCIELQRRGYQAVNGDTELAYQGDPETGAPTDTHLHEHHIWRVDAVRKLAAQRDEPMTFFCGGSRNLAAFLDVFDGVFVLDITLPALLQRLDARPEDEWGGKPAERELILHLHGTREDLPAGLRIDATQPLAVVVDDILRQALAHDP